jgi:thiamine biosynthesis lipoprotein
MRDFLGIIFVWVILSLFHPAPDIRKFQLHGNAQGTTYHITYFASDSIVASFQIDSILEKIDNSLSLYKPWSLINQFNNGSEKIRMDEHFDKVVQRSLEITADSKGIFDLTVFPLVQAWGFGPIKVDTVPSSSQIEAIRQCVGSYYLKVDGDWLYKTKPCLKLDPNGIAQGYSVDVLADFLERNGINNYLVELGGEIRIKGKKQPGNLPFTIGIEAPVENEFTEDKLEKTITIDSGAITTSGSYRKFKQSNGRKISHIIDARTGYPSVNELISVTVYAKDAITADGYDNVLMVMGLDEAFRFLKERKDISAYFIYRKKDGSIGDTATSQFYTPGP